MRFVGKAFDGVVFTVFEVIPAGAGKAMTRARLTVSDE